MPSIRLSCVAFCAALAVAAGAIAQQPSITRPRFKVEGPYVLGRANAPVTIVEFSDYECSFCQRHHATAYAEIKKNFIDTGKVRYVIRDYPLPFHRQAVPATRTVRCAGEQGKFWEMRNALMSGETPLRMESMLERAAELKLDVEKLRACIASFRFDRSIRNDMEQADAQGVNSTPSFLIGRSRGDSVEGELMVGAQPYPTFETRIKALLEAR